jgi:hypothetical protein
MWCKPFFVKVILFITQLRTSRCKLNCGHFGLQKLFISSTQQQKKMYEEASEIFHDELSQRKLYLGSQYTAERLDSLKELKISLIVNCAIQLPNYFIRYSSMFKYINCSITDDHDVDIVCHFDKLLPMIDSVLRSKNNNGNVFIHCQAGMSRSATVTIAYLMKYRDMNLKEAYDYVKLKRNVIQPNIGFVNQLCQYELTLRNNSSLTLLDYIMMEYIPMWFGDESDNDEEDQGSNKKNKKLSEIQLYKQQRNDKFHSIVSDCISRANGNMDTLMEHLLDIDY